MIKVLDKVAAVLGLVVTAPLMLCAAVGIRVTSPGPVLHRARRAGLGGEVFTMYKLRTMHLGSQQGGRITSSVDARVFPVGRVLRRSKLDEVPQLVNVLRGEMSLVGPRPEDVDIVAEHYDAMMWESLTVPPGITSPGSLDFFADESALPDEPAAAERYYLAELLPRKIALDLVYVRHRSTTYYVGLVIRTLFGVVGVERPFRRRVAWEKECAARYLDEAGVL